MSIKHQMFLLLILLSLLLFSKSSRIKSRNLSKNRNRISEKLNQLLKLTKLNDAKGSDHISSMILSLIDTDGDNKITKEEIEAFISQNSDISKEKAAEEADYFIRKYDGDTSGALEGGEVSEFVGSLWGGFGL